MNIRRTIPLLVLILCCSAGEASALALTAAGLPYADAPRDRKAQVALSYALAAGVIEPRMYVYPRRFVTRAEFVKMVVVAAGIDHAASEDCFADTRAGDWFSSFACAAKKKGVVRGYPQGSIAVFRPHQRISYAEAAKMLATAFDIPTMPSLMPSSPWYEPYMRAIDGLNMKNPLRLVEREQAIELVSRAMAEKRGEISEYMSAIERSSSSLSSSSRRSVSSSASSVSSLSSSAHSFPLDPLSDTTVRARFALLGETSPVIGAVNVFLEHEPFIVRSMSIDLAVSASSVQSLMVFDDKKRFLGNATLDTSVAGSKRYTLTLPSGSLIIPKRTTQSFYVRASLSSRELGGVSGQIIRMQDFLVAGYGEWTNEQYTAHSADQSFITLQTAWATIASVTNADESTGFLSAGMQRKIGSFTIEARSTESGARPAVTSLTFQLEPRGGVEISAVKIGADDGVTRASCTVSDTVVACGDLSGAFGDLWDGPRTLSLYADIALLPGGLNPALRVSLNNPGSIAEAGAITWTDGSTVFSWVPFGSPIAEGTFYR